VILVNDAPSSSRSTQNLESAARVSGARTASVFRHVLVHAPRPGHTGRVASRAGADDRDVRAHLPDGGSDSQTLVVALYYAVFAAGVRAPQSVDAMAMIYMGVTLVWLLIALRFVNPTQLVSRVKEHPQGAV
jgi:putative spermidine/putrescine transport system permease protein